MTHINGMVVTWGFTVITVLQDRLTLCVTTSHRRPRQNAKIFPVKVLLLELT